MALSPGIWKMVYGLASTEIQAVLHLREQTEPEQRDEVRQEITTVLLQAARQRDIDAILALEGILLSAEREYLSEAPDKEASLDNALEVAGGSRFILPQATRDEVKKIPWLAPHFADEEGRLIMSIHALVVETPERKILVDTCIGNDKQRSIPTWSNLQLPFLDDLKTAGYDRHSIDTVMCTHLHVDHVGWNTMLVDGEWLPTFPNARYLIAQQEYEYWDSEEAEELSDGIMGDSVRPVFDAGLVDLVEMEHQVCEEVRLEPTTGHTPGHVSVHINSEGEEALITGDCIHHPCQIERLDWASSADYDQGASTKTRHALMDRYADQDILIIGTHFATPTAGHLKSKESGYWFDVGS